MAARVIPAALLYTSGVFILNRADDAANIAATLVAVALFIAAAALVTIPLYRFLSDSAGSLFSPGVHYDGPLPMYSIPESKRKSGLFEEAMAGYEKLAEQHPDEVKPYIGMMEIAAIDLHDLDRATRIYEKGMSLLTGSGDQEVLANFYIANCSRHAGEPQWIRAQREKMITPRKNPSA